jgi:hypothetical protein
MSRPSNQEPGFPPPHDPANHPHPPQHDPRLQPGPGATWGYPAPSFSSLVAALGDEDIAYTARLALERSPDEMRVIVDLLIRLMLDRWQTGSPDAPKQARPPDYPARF